VLALIKAIFPAVHVHPHKPIHAFSQPFDPMTSELQPDEHGVVRRLSAQMVQANGLILDYAGDGPSTWRVM
jgi:hypothetical protein